MPYTMAPAQVHSFPLQPDPAPGWFETFGSSALGTSSDLLLDAIMKGRLGPMPTGTVNSSRTPGMYGPATQQGEFLSPQAIQRFQQQVNQGRMSPQSLPQGVNFTQTGSRIGFQPSMDYQTQQANLQKTQQDLAQAPLDFERIKEQTALARAQRQAYESGAPLIRFADPVTGLEVSGETPGAVPLYISPGRYGESRRPLPKDTSPGALSRAMDAELGPAEDSLPSDLPDPARYKDGTKATDKTTNQRYILHLGQWRPL